MVFIKIHYLDDRTTTVLCDSVDVCPNHTCVIHGGDKDGTIIYNTCGAEVLLDKDNHYIECDI